MRPLLILSIVSSLLFTSAIGIDQAEGEIAVNQSNSNILFSRSTGALNSGGTLDLMMYNPLTQRTTLLQKGTVSRRGEYGASISPYNSKIITNTYKFGGWKLGIADFKDTEITNLRKLTNSSNYEYSGKFSPDGLKIVYEEFNWGTRDSDITVCDQNGNNPKHLYKPKISGQSFDWTRDSKSIVFTSAEDKNLKICMMSIEGKVLKKLSDQNVNDFAPSTSKTEDKIAFLSDETGKIDLFVMNIDGTNRINLTPDLKSADAANISGLWAYGTSWSPDGTQIVFNVMFNGNLEIFIVNSDGTGLTQITHNNDADITPFWMSKNLSI